MKLPTPKWPLGQILYMRVAEEDGGGMLTGYVIRPNGLLYLITWGDGDEKTHWEMELSDEKSFGDTKEAAEG